LVQNALTQFEGVSIATRSKVIEACLGQRKNSQLFCIYDDTVPLIAKFVKNSNLSGC